MLQFANIDETVRGIHGAKLNVLQYSRLRPIYCGGELSTITIDESFSIYSITPKLQSPQNSVKRLNDNDNETTVKM